MNRTTAACIFLAYSLCVQAVTSGSWHTYHGDYALTGMASQTFPDKPLRLWRTRVGSGLPSPVVGGDGRLFCVADNSTITALDTKGSNLWSRTIASAAAAPEGKPAGESFSAPPLYAHRGLLVVAADSGVVYGLSPADGKTLWTFETGSEIQGSPNYAAPTTNDQPGRVCVITCEEGVVYALRSDNGIKLWESEPLGRTDGHIAVGGAHIVLGNCTASILALKLSDGSIGSCVAIGEGCEMAGGVAVSNGQAFAGNRSGSLAGARLADGAVMWMFEESEGEMFSTPAVSDTRVVFHGSDTVLYCLDRASGKKLWSKECEGYEPRAPLIAGDLVIAVVDGTLIGVALKDGTERWRLSAGDEVSQAAIVDGMLVLSVDDGCVVAYGRDKNK